MRPSRYLAEISTAQVALDSKHCAMLLDRFGRHVLICRINQTHVNRHMALISIRNQTLLALSDLKYHIRVFVSIFGLNLDGFRLHPEPITAYYFLALSDLTYHIFVLIHAC